MVNNGMDVGAMGRRRGKGAARMMNSLTHGYPLFFYGSTLQISFASEVLHSETQPNCKLIKNEFESFDIDISSRFPSLGLAGVKNVNDGDRKGVQETFRSLGIPTSLASLGKCTKFLDIFVLIFDLFSARRQSTE